MIRSQKAVTADAEPVSNWAIGTEPNILTRIHDPEINIAIQERAISPLAHEVSRLPDENIGLKTSGDISTIVDAITKALPPNSSPLIIQDIHTLLLHFREVVQVEQFRLLLATVNTNMCRKFHTDINDVRLLCTYSGPGTLWLTNDNINRSALSSYADNDSIVLEESEVRQAKTGAVVLLKGAIYPQEKTSAVVHRSPTIEESGEKRLLLRIDTNEALNLWI
ncbi:MAG: DUF1826 domain-containing protein [Bacteroidota bacterium]